MADERDLELLDDYLTNRMSEQETSAFERKLQADPDLQHEYALQQRMIKGIRDARVSQLKSMLNQVPIPANNTGTTLASKILLGAVVSILVAATAWYLTRDGIKSGQPQVTSKQDQVAKKPVITESEEPVVQTPQPVEKETALSQKQVVETDKNQTSAGTEHSRPSLAKKPDPLQAPGAKSTATEENGVGVSSLKVQTETGNTRYPFHYQIAGEKLVLYGPFSANAYQLVALPGTERGQTFLYYNEQYYALETADSTIKPLTAITDKGLLQKLREQQIQK